MNGKGQGHGVDAQGGPVIDPTENVLALVAAEAKRQDDLRLAFAVLVDSKISAVNDRVSLRAEIANLRAAHYQELSTMESARLNAIRQVDVLAVSTAAERAGVAVDAIAKITAANAENLRTALNTTATTIATQLQQTVTAISDRIAALEKSSYEGKGKQAYSDPMMIDVINELKGLRQNRASDAGQSAGKAMITGPIWAVVGAVVTAVLTAAVLALFTASANSTRLDAVRIPPAAARQR